MPTTEHDQPNDLGPIADGEEERIVKDALAFLWLCQHNALRSLESSDYQLRDAPAHLVRRILLQKPAEYGDSWIPFGELPDGLYQRAHLADECRRSIFQASNPNQPSDQDDLTVEDIQRIYRHEHWLAIERLKTPVHYDFDLHDVYICAEGALLLLYAKRDHPDPEELAQQGLEIAAPDDLDMLRTHYRELSRQARSVLAVIGQALGESDAGKP